MRLSTRTGDQHVELMIERQDGHYIVEIEGTRHLVDAQKLEGDFFSILTGDRSYEVSVEARQDSYLVRHGATAQLVSVSDPSRRAREAGAGAGTGPERVVSPMPGRVVRILVEEGDTVAPGQGVAVVEAMKMENEIVSERGGTVTSVSVSVGDTVDGDGELLVVTP